MQIQKSLSGSGRLAKYALSPALGQSRGAEDQERGTARPGRRCAPGTALCTELAGALRTTWTRRPKNRAGVSSSSSVVKCCRQKIGQDRRAADGSQSALGGCGQPRQLRQRLTGLSRQVRRKTDTSRDLAPPRMAQLQYGRRHHPRLAGARVMCRSADMSLGL